MSHNLNNQDQPANENENHLIGNILAEDNSDSDQEETKAPSGGINTQPATFGGKIGFGGAGTFGLGGANAPYGGAFNNTGIPDRVGSSATSDLSVKYFGQESPQNKKQLGYSSAAALQNQGLTGKTFSNIFPSADHYGGGSQEPLIRRPSEYSQQQDVSKLTQQQLQFLAQQQQNNSQQQQNSSDTASNSSLSKLSGNGNPLSQVQQEIGNQPDIYRTKEYFDYYHSLNILDPRLPVPQYLPSHTDTHSSGDGVKSSTEELEKKLGALALNSDDQFSQGSTRSSQQPQNQANLSSSLKSGLNFGTPFDQQLAFANQHAFQQQQQNLFFGNLLNLGAQQTPMQNVFQQQQQAAQQNQTQEWGQKQASSSQPQHIHQTQHSFGSHKGKKGKGRGGHYQELQLHQQQPPPMPKPPQSAPAPKQTTNQGLMQNFSATQQAQASNHRAAVMVPGAFNQQLAANMGQQPIQAMQQLLQNSISQQLPLGNQYGAQVGSLPKLQPGGLQNPQASMMLGYPQWAHLPFNQNQGQVMPNAMQQFGAQQQSQGAMLNPLAYNQAQLLGNAANMINAQAMMAAAYQQQTGVNIATLDPQHQALLMQNYAAMSMSMQNPFAFQQLRMMMGGNQGGQMIAPDGSNPNQIGGASPFGAVMGGQNFQYTNSTQSNQSPAGQTPPSETPHKRGAGSGQYQNAQNSHGGNESSSRGGRGHFSANRGGGNSGGQKGGHDGGHSKGGASHQSKRDTQYSHGYDGGKHDSQSLQSMQPTQLPKSPFLEDLRAKIQNGKKIDIRDIKDHVVECSMDQYGSRFIQQKYDVTTPEEKDLIFAEILPEANGLMNDVFGNYVVQKLFEYGTEAQRATLAEQLLGNVLKLTKSMYGCRVVQKALEVILLDQQKLLVQELKDAVLDCIYDQNGNHVIQKCIEKMPHDSVDFIVQAILNHRGAVGELCIHTYGCRVIQRILENCHERQTQPILDAIVANIQSLIKDQFGNYVIQHILEQGKNPEIKNQIVKSIKGRVIEFSNHKFASNVVEKCLEYGSDKERKEIIDEFLESTNYDAGEEVMGLGGSQLNGALYTMMKDRYGNYVIQKCIEVGKGKQREVLVKKITACANVLRKQANYSRHVYNFIEKMSSEGGGSQGAAQAKQGADSGQVQSEGNPNGNQQQYVQKKTNNAASKKRV